jgi:hypothetical protein
MKAKTKFLKMFYKLPQEARKELVYDFVVNPMTLNVVCLEVRNDTTLGKSILEKLGYRDDNNANTNIN